MFVLGRESSTVKGRIALVFDPTVPAGTTVTPLQFTDEQEIDAHLAADKFTAHTGKEYKVFRLVEVVTVEEPTLESFPIAPKA